MKYFFLNFTLNLIWQFEFYTRRVAESEQKKKNKLFCREHIHKNFFKLSVKAR